MKNMDLVIEIYAWITDAKVCKLHSSLFKCNEKETRLR